MAKSNAPRIISHQERLVNWGSAPDCLALDRFAVKILEHYGASPQAVVDEICRKRRDLGKYAFCSPRTLSSEKIMHLPLESIPFEVPPLRLKVGRKKDATIVVDRMLPASSYGVEYQSSGESGCFYFRSERLPEAMFTGLSDRPINQIISGIPDDRITRGVRYERRAGSLGIRLQVDASLVIFHAYPVERRMRLKIEFGHLQFRSGVEEILEQVTSHNPDAMGLRMFARDLIEVASLHLEGPEWSGRYIALRPHGSARNPTLNLQGCFRSIPFGCYLVRASDVPIEQLSACLQKAKMVTYNEPAFIDFLTKEI